MSVIPAGCEPVDAIKLTSITKLTVEIILPPAVQLKVLLIEKYPKVNILLPFQGPMHPNGMGDESDPQDTKY